ncbi:hypothetical protein GGR01_000413 [Acetobacter oeni]|nr:hypothetical protein [Acetobacter oeni]
MQCSGAGAAGALTGCSVTGRDRKAGFGTLPQSFRRRRRDRGVRDP